MKDEKYNPGVIIFNKVDFLRTTITAKSDLMDLNTNLIIDVGLDYLSLKIADIDYTGKTIKCASGNSGWYRNTFTKDLPIGKFYFDEEDSTEDELIVYF